jgi:hypothetical protein
MHMHVRHACSRSKRHHADPRNTMHMSSLCSGPRDTMHMLSLCPFMSGSCLASLVLDHYMYTPTAILAEA